MSINRLTSFYYCYNFKQWFFINTFYKVGLILLLIVISFISNAQTNANCFAPYNPTPATVWGISEKFQSNPLIWNGGTPTAADLNNDGISEILVPASDNSGYYTYKGNGTNKTTATKNYVIATTNARSVQPAIANIIGEVSSAPEVVMVLWNTMKIYHYAVLKEYSNPYRIHLILQ
jgi:hypothetical protein